MYSICTSTPVTVSPLVRPVVVANLKISSPEPPTRLSLLLFEPSSTIRKEPFETAEPSIVVTLSVVVVVICNDELPRLVNVSLPKVKLVVLLPSVIFSML